MYGNLQSGATGNVN